AEDLAHNIRLAGPEETIVDEDAGELIPDGLVNEGRGDAGINTSAQTEDHPLATHLGPDLFHRLVEVAAHRPLLAAPADPVDEIRDDLPAPWGMPHLRMKLRAEKSARAVLEPGAIGILRGRNHSEFLRQARQPIPARVPDLEGGRKTLEQGPTRRK